MNTYTSRLERLIQALISYVLKPWYPPLLAFLAALDHFVIVIPTDGLLITAILAAPKRWFRYFAWLTVGSVIGGTLLAGTIQLYGTPFLEWLSPGIHETYYWKLMDSWVDHYGLWTLFFVSALPIFQHPVIAITALAELPLLQIAAYLFAGRCIKFGLYSWLALRAPRALFRLKSIRKEVQEVSDRDPLDAAQAGGHLGQITPAGKRSASGQK